MHIHYCPDQNKRLDFFTEISYCDMGKHRENINTKLCIAAPEMKTFDRVH